MQPAGTFGRVQRPPLVSSPDGAVKQCQLAAPSARGGGEERVRAFGHSHWIGFDAAAEKPRRTPRVQGSASSAATSASLGWSGSTAGRATRQEGV
eukprot:tig00000806_g4353.t1